MPLGKRPSERPLADQGSSGAAPFQSLEGAPGAAALSTGTKRAELVPPSAKERPSKTCNGTQGESHPRGAKWARQNAMGSSAHGMQWTALLNVGVRNADQPSFAHF